MAKEQKKDPLNQAARKSPAAKKSAAAKKAAAKSRNVAPKKAAVKKAVAKGKPATKKSAPPKVATPKQKPIKHVVNPKPQRAEQPPKPKADASQDNKKKLAVQHMWDLVQAKKQRATQTPAPWQAIEHHDHPAPRTSTRSFVGSRADLHRRRKCPDIAIAGTG